MSEYIVAAELIARGVGREGIEEAILEGAICAAYGFFLLGLLEPAGRA